MTSYFIVKKIQQIKNVVNCLEFSRPNSDYLEEKLHTMMKGTALSISFIKLSPVHNLSDLIIMVLYYKLIP